MPDQTAAALSRSGQEVGLGGDAAARCARHGVVAVGRRRWAATRRRRWTAARLSRPSWSLDDAIWVVVDGNNVVRVIQEAASGQPARIPVDSTAVSTRFPGAVTELQLSRDGTRAAMVIDGQVILAGVEQTPGGGTR